MLVHPAVRRAVEGPKPAYFLIGFDGGCTGGVVVVGCCPVAGVDLEQRVENFETQRDEVNKLCGAGASVVGIAAPRQECCRYESEASDHLTYVTLPAFTLKDTDTTPTPFHTKLTTITKTFPATTHSLRIAADRHDNADEIVQNNIDFIVDKIMQRYRGRSDGDAILLPTHTGTVEDVWAMAEADESVSGFVEVRLSFGEAVVSGCGVNSAEAEARVDEDVARLLLNSVEEMRMRGALQPGDNVIPARVRVFPKSPALASLPVWYGFGKAQDIKDIYAELLFSKVLLSEDRQRNKQQAQIPNALFIGLATLMTAMAAFIGAMWSDDDAWSGAPIVLPRSQRP